MISIDKIKIAGAIAEVSTAMAIIQQAAVLMRNARMKIQEELNFGVDVHTPGGAQLKYYEHCCADCEVEICSAMSGETNPNHEAALEALRQIVDAHTRVVEVNVQEPLRVIGPIDAKIEVPATKGVDLRASEAAALNASEAVQ